MSKHIINFVVFLSLVIITETFSQGIPETINYQGVLKDASGNVIPNGNYDLTFTLYDSESGGTNLWAESKNLGVTDGIVNTQLGSAVPLWANIFDAAVWLGIKVGTGSELTPRIRLTSVPYSFYTMNVLDGSITASKIADAEVVKSLNGLKDNVNLVAGSNVTITPSGNNITISAAGGSGGISGSGSTDYIAKFTGGTSIGSTIISEISGRIGLDDITSTYKININAASTSGLGLKIHRSGGTNLLIKDDGSPVDEKGWTFNVFASKLQIRTIADNDLTTLSNVMTFQRDGNVGIGITTPATTLDVNGTATLSGTSNELNRTQTGNANLVPIAYATVNSNGTLYSNSTTTNVSLSSHTAGTGRYEFTITGEDIFYQNYVCNVTLLSMGECYWNSVSGKLIIYTANSSGTPTDKIFSFVIYKK